MLSQLDFLHLFSRGQRLEDPFELVNRAGDPVRDENAYDGNGKDEQQAAHKDLGGYGIFDDGQAFAVELVDQGLHHRGVNAQARDQGDEHHGYDDDRHEPDLESPFHHELLSDDLLMSHSLETSNTDAGYRMQVERQIRNPKHEIPNKSKIQMFQTLVAKFYVILRLDRRIQSMIVKEGLLLLTCIVHPALPTCTLNPVFLNHEAHKERQP